MSDGEPLVKLDSATTGEQFSWYLRVNESGIPVIAVRENIEKPPALATQGLVSSLYTAGRHAGIHIKLISTRPLTRPSGRWGGPPAAGSMRRPSTTAAGPGTPSSFRRSSAIPLRTEVTEKDKSQDSTYWPQLAFAQSADEPLCALFTNRAASRTTAATMLRLRRMMVIANACVTSSIGISNLRALMDNPNLRAIRQLLATESGAIQRSLRDASRSLWLPAWRFDTSLCSGLSVHLAPAQRAVMSTFLSNALLEARASLGCIVFRGVSIVESPEWTALGHATKGAIMLRVLERTKGYVKRVTLSDVATTPVSKQFPVFLCSRDVWSTPREALLSDVPCTCVVSSVAVTTSRFASDCPQLNIRVGEDADEFLVILVRPASKVHRASMQPRRSVTSADRQRFSTGGVETAIAHACTGTPKWVGHLTSTLILLRSSAADISTWAEGSASESSDQSARIPIPILWRQKCSMAGILPMLCYTSDHNSSFTSALTLDATLKHEWAPVALVYEITGVSTHPEIRVHTWPQEELSAFDPQSMHAWLHLVASNMILQPIRNSPGMAVHTIKTAAGRTKASQVQLAFFQAPQLAEDIERPAIRKCALLVTKAHAISSEYLVERSQNMELPVFCSNLLSSLTALAAS